MSASEHRFLSNLIRDIRQERDELALQIHLGKQELKDEWDALDEKLSQLNHRFDPLKDAVGETGEDVWDSLKLVAGELQEGFHRVGKVLKEELKRKAK
jgi:uncharacterized coiled-coil DUF342 family protein